MRFLSPCLLSPCLPASLAILLCLTLAPPAVAQEAGIESTIRRQIEAFEADDFATAFTYASPNIRALFGTPENFGRMVANGYPMVHHPETVEMGPLREVAGALWQRVDVTDAEGRRHALDYQMIQTPDGQWQINAVELLKADDVGV
jgi:hypothetical protein